jgi:hypothetical protein
MPSNIVPLARVLPRHDDSSERAATQELAFLW